jgi:hypothetical protein
MTAPQKEQETGDYCDERDIPKIISFLERTSIRNGWDAHIGDGAGDCDIRIPAKHVQGFIEMLRSRPTPSPQKTCMCDKYTNCTDCQQHDTAIRTEECNKILRLVESDEWQKEHDAETRNATLDKFKPLISMHDVDGLPYADLYNEFLSIYKLMRD